jgi:hypothetical protein
MQYILVYGNRILSIHFQHNKLLLQNKNNTTNTNTNTNTKLYNITKKINIFKYINMHFFRKVNEFEMSIFSY